MVDPDDLNQENVELVDSVPVGLPAGSPSGGSVRTDVSEIARLGPVTASRSRVITQKRWRSGCPAQRPSPRPPGSRSNGVGPPARGRGEPTRSYRQQSTQCRRRVSARVFEFCSGLVDLVVCVGCHGGGGHLFACAGERFVGLVAEDLA